jgi:hypothetical protein
VTLSPDAVAALPAADADFDVAALTGQVLATPTESGVGLSVPFQMVPHGRSRVVASAVRTTEGVSEIGVRNLGLHAGDADLYEWVLSDGRDAGTFGDLRAVGVQVFDAPPELGSAVPDDKLLVFAISLHQRFSSAAENEYHLLADVDGDNTADHLLVAADAGLLLDGVASGELAAFAIDLAADEVGILPVIAPPGGSVLLVPALASDLGVTAAAPSFAVTAATTSVAQRGEDDTIEGAASVNVFDPQRSAGDFLALAPGATGSFPVTSRAPAGAEIASLGWMVVTLDDRSGVEQAALVPA